MGIVFNADEVFEMGMDIETNGMAYYRKAQELARDPEAADVLKMLYEEEKKHLETFRRLREAIPAAKTSGTVRDPEGIGSLYLDALVKSRLFSNVREAEAAASSAKDEMEALRSALAFEKDTILFFMQMKEMVREDLGRDEIDKLIDEEHRHVVVIMQEMKKARERSR